MKRTRNVLMLAALVTLSIFMSCGGGGGGSTPTLQKQIIDALNGQTVALDIANSTFGTATVTSGTVTVNASETGSVTIDTGSVTIDTGDDLASYVESGSFTVSSSGSITGTSVTAASGSGLAFSGFGATVDEDISVLTITFNSGEASRSAGLGSWSLKVNL